jgi:hypothetical protein
MKKPIIFGTAVITLIVMLFLLAGCGSPGGASRTQDVTNMLASVGDLSLNLPKTLKSSASSKENIDYENLPEVKSQAYFYLTLLVEGIEGHMAGINSDLDLMETDIIPGSNLEPGQIYSETFENGETIKIKYNFTTTTAGTEYMIITMATFDASGTVTGGTYIEVTEAEDETISGQGQYIMVGESGNHYSKLVFDTATDILTAYSNMTSEAEGLELSTIKVTKDAEDTENGVFVSMKWNTDSWGNHTQIAWANDSYGGVVSEDIIPVGEDTQNGMYTEYFALSENKSKIIYRQRGDEVPDILWELIDMAREDVTGLNEEGKNAYTAELTEAPLFLAMEYTAGTDGWEIYEWDEENEVTKGNALASNTTGDPLTVDELFWFEGTEASAQTGDALYKYVYSPDVSDPSIAVFEKVSEVPQTVPGLGTETNYYIQEMYPLKWVRGTFEASGDTIIQTESLGDIDGDGTDDYRYWLDNNDDGVYDMLNEVELMVWTFPETYYDEETETMVTTESTPWFLGDIPAYGTIDPEYIWQDAFDAVNQKLISMGQEDHIISTIEVPAFPVLGEEWKDVSDADFTEAE